MVRLLHHPTLYLPSLRHLAVPLSTLDKEFLMNHASQLTRLECNDVSLVQDNRFPLLRHLDVTLRRNDTTSFLQHCPSLTHLNATLEYSGQIDLLPFVSTVVWGANDLLPVLHLATRLTSIHTHLAVIQQTMQHLLPVASRLKKLYLRGEAKKQDCAALLALCPMLEELWLVNLHIDSNASLSLPHLIKLHVNLRDYSPEEAFQCLHKFLVVAPRLREVILDLYYVDKSRLKSFLQAAEKAGVERADMFVNNATSTHDYTLCWIKAKML